MGGGGGGGKLWLLVFILWPHFRQFSCIPVWPKVMNILSHLPGCFQIFLFFCWRQHCLISIVVTFLFLLRHVIFCLFTFWEEKKCIPGFNPWLYILSKFEYFKEISRTCHISDDVIQKLMTSQRIYMHHTNPIVLKLPCAKLHVSSCSQTKVKVGGGGQNPPTQKWGSESPPGIGLKVNRYNR